MASHDMENDQSRPVPLRQRLADIVNQAAVEFVFVIFRMPPGKKRGNGILSEILLRGISVDVIPGMIQHGHDRGARMHLVE